MFRTGLFAFDHSTGRRYISSEALHDLPGTFGYRNGITDAASDQEIFKRFADVIDRVARRYPDASTVLTSKFF